MKKQIILMLAIILVLPTVLAWNTNYQLTQFNNQSYSLVNGQLVLNETGNISSDNIKVTSEGYYLSDSYLNNSLYVAGVNSTLSKWKNIIKAGLSQLNWIDETLLFYDNVFSHNFDQICNGCTKDYISSWEGIWISGMINSSMVVNQTACFNITTGLMTCNYNKLNTGWNLIGIMNNISKEKINITISLTEPNEGYPGINAIGYSGLEDYNLSDIKITNGTITCNYYDCVNQGYIDPLGFINDFGITSVGNYTSLKAGQGFIVYNYMTGTPNINFYNIHAVPTGVQIPWSSLIFTNETLESEDIHVDSLNTQMINAKVKLYYDTEPNSIDHYYHNGSKEGTYYPFQWTWTDICNVDLNAGGQVCSGGYVILPFNGLDYGLGSNTFVVNNSNNVNGYFTVNQTTGLIIYNRTNLTDTTGSNISITGMNNAYIRWSNGTVLLNSLNSTGGNYTGNYTFNLLNNGTFYITDNYLLPVLNGVVNGFRWIIESSNVLTNFTSNYFFNNTDTVKRSIYINKTNSKISNGKLTSPSHITDYEINVTLQSNSVINIK